ncbi:MAG: chorismate mutase, partial [Rhodospirillaceae bacterium]
MADIRREINRLDEVLIPLLVERLSYVGKAADFKAQRQDVVVPWRIEEVVQRAAQKAESLGGDPYIVERIWRALVDVSI